MGRRSNSHARGRRGLAGPGTKLHHSFGVWPLVIDDSTEVVQIEPGHAWYSKREDGRSARPALRSPSKPTATVPWSRSPRTSRAARSVGS